ncbi:hypothetical protein FWG86_00680 [Candidatus Saccharibacteria bacterium]|nr:hypothetical protein [Candidatus Saccharibacteria bacterium]
MSKHQVIIPAGIIPFPEQFEITAANLLADFFKTDVEFVKRSGHKTPDFCIDGIHWELKSPTGRGKHNIQHQLQAAARQSPNVILDSRRSKVHQSKIKREAEYQFRIIKRAKRLVVITKSGQVLEITK